MNQYLYRLLSNPVDAWKKIQLENYKNNLQIINENLSLFLFINPFLHSLFSLYLFSHWKSFAIAFILKPFVFTLFGIVALVLISLLLEEIYRISSTKEPGQNIFKWTVFSFIPLFSFYGFLRIPVIGKFIFITGIIYSLYLLVYSFYKFLWGYKSQRRTLFIFSSITGIVILITAGIVSLMLLSSLRIF